jgi:hypothetical protein
VIVVSGSRVLFAKRSFEVLRIESIALVNAVSARSLLTEVLFGMAVFRPHGFYYMSLNFDVE